eukprot:1148822-Pelagomonas_calceolata.AAC.5
MIQTSSFFPFNTPAINLGMTGRVLFIFLGCVPEHTLKHSAPHVCRPHHPHPWTGHCPSAAMAGLVVRRAPAKARAAEKERKQLAGRAGESSILGRWAPEAEAQRGMERATNVWKGKQ